MAPPLTPALALGADRAAVLVAALEVARVTFTSSRVRREAQVHCVDPLLVKRGCDSSRVEGEGPGPTAVPGRRGTADQ